MRLSRVSLLPSVALVLFILVVSYPTVTEGFFDTVWNMFDAAEESSMFNPERKKCFGALGCIEYTPEWYVKEPPIRPINRLPEDRPIVNTQFFFSNPKISNNLIKVYTNKKNLLDQGFKPSKQTKFIVHGFLDKGTSFWQKELADALLKAGDFNVFVVDWAVGSHTLYTQATANTLVVGLEIAFYIKFLQREFPQMTLDQFHCIGHSLGSHICGYVGEKLEGKLGRITGLDPAGPLFQYMPTQVTLDPTDAKFVDTIHSDGRTDLLLGFGMVQPCGHMDFYPNDGQLQPGCKPDKITDSVFRSKSLDEANRQIFACNHHRAIYYYIEAMNTTASKFVGHACQDYYDYSSGKCGPCKPDGSNCARLGLDAAKYPIGERSLVRFYLSTAPEYPFCLRHYLVNIRLAFPQDIADKQVLGKLKIILEGFKHSASKVLDSEDVDTSMDGERNLAFVIESSLGLGPIKNVKLVWKSAADRIFGESVYKTRCLMHGCNYRMFVERLQVTDMDAISQTKYGSSILCGEDKGNYTQIRSGSSASFSRKC